MIIEISVDEAERLVILLRHLARAEQRRALETCMPTGDRLERQGDADHALATRIEQAIWDQPIGITVAGRRALEGTTLRLVRDEPCAADHSNG